jgi:hypothetical protein
MRKDVLFSYCIDVLDKEGLCIADKIEIIRNLLRFYREQIKLDVEKHIIDGEKDAALCALNALYDL